MQNVYNQSKSQKTISINFHYSVVFCNGRDALQFRTMAYQICLSNEHWLVNALTDATFKPYRYLVLDYHPLTPKDLTVEITILPVKQLIYNIKTTTKSSANTIV